MKKILIMTVFALALGACAPNNNSPAASSGGPVNFNLPAISGSQFNSSVDAKGQPMLLSFMATYCGYCKMSVPKEVELSKTYGPKGLKVVGIFADNTKDGPAQFAKEQGVTFDVLYNGGDLARQMGVSGVPHFVLLDKNHNVVKTWTGYSPNHNFSEEINKVL